MGLPSGLPVVDHHCHLSPRGEGIEAARRFRKAGGTHLFLATQNYEAQTPLSVDDYRRQFDATETLARQVREMTGTVVYVVVAPYPIDLVRAAPVLGVLRAQELHRRALDLAGALVREQRAVAVGEVGRPHFPVPDEIGLACDEVFRYALELARDLGCPAVVHSDDLDRDGFAALGKTASALGLGGGRVIKHYTRTRILGAQDTGVVPSYVARRELTDAVVADPAPWFLETDFLDDPARPGAVLDLATIPRRAAAIAQRSAVSAELLWNPFVRSVEEVYGFRPESTASPAGS